MSRAFGPRSQGVDKNLHLWARSGEVLQTWHGTRISAAQTCAPAGPSSRLLCALACPLLSSRSASQPLLRVPCDEETLEALHRSIGSGPRVNDLAVSHNGERLVAVCSERKILLCAISKDAGGVPALNTAEENVRPVPRGSTGATRPHARRPLRAPRTRRQSARRAPHPSSRGASDVRAAP
eukprot:1182148-Prymnesium_polylepis.1